MSQMEGIGPYLRPWNPDLSCGVLRCAPPRDCLFRTFPKNCKILRWWKVLFCRRDRSWFLHHVKELQKLGQKYPRRFWPNSSPGQRYEALMFAKLALKKRGKFFWRGSLCFAPSLRFFFPFFRIEALTFTCHLALSCQYLSFDLVQVTVCVIIVGTDIVSAMYCQCDGDLP